MAVWGLRRFELCLKEWFANDGPTSTMQNLAIQWAISRAVDPYLEATRVTGAGRPNHWLALVQVPPGCDDVVVAEFDIFETDHAVQCEGISTLPANVLGKY